MSEDSQPGRDRCGSACLGRGEHDNRVLERLQEVPLRRNDQHSTTLGQPAVWASGLVRCSVSRGVMAHRP